MCGRGGKQQNPASPEEKAGSAIPPIESGLPGRSMRTSSPALPWTPFSSSTRAVALVRNHYDDNHSLLWSTHAPTACLCKQAPSCFLLHCSENSEGTQWKHLENQFLLLWRITLMNPLEELSYAITIALPLLKQYCLLDLLPLSLLLKSVFKVDLLRQWPCSELCLWYP